MKIFDAAMDATWTGRYTKGPTAKNLAKAIADRTNYKYGVPFAQATHVIFILARWYWNLGYRKAWIPRYTWSSTYEPFEWLGYHVKYVDIDETTWLADFADRVYDINEIVCPVDTFGSVFPISDIPDCGTIPWVDSAQSLGSDWDSTEPHRVVSMSASKTITSGEGGILLTQSQELADYAKEIGSWLSRMPEISASIGTMYLNHLDEYLEKKKVIADEYKRIFPQFKWQRIPVETNDYIVAAEVDDPESIIEKNRDWEFKRYWLVDDDSLPVSKELSHRILAFPSWPGLPLEEITNLKT